MFILWGHKQFDRIIYQVIQKHMIFCITDIFEQYQVSTLVVLLVILQQWNSDWSIIDNISL